MKFASAFPLAFVLAFAAVCSAQTVYVSGRNTDVVFRFDYATGSSEGPISGSGIDNPTGNVLDTPGRLYVGNSNTNSTVACPRSVRIRRIAVPPPVMHYRQRQLLGLLAGRST